MKKAAVAVKTSVSSAQEQEEGKRDHTDSLSAIATTELWQCVKGGDFDGLVWLLSQHPSLMHQRHLGDGTLLYTAVQGYYDSDHCLANQLGLSTKPLQFPKDPNHSIFGIRSRAPATQHGQIKDTHAVLLANPNPLPPDQLKAVWRQTLLDQVNVVGSERQGESVLIAAVRARSAQLVRLLLECKADPLYRDQHGLSALHTCCERGFHECLRMRAILQALLHGGAVPMLTMFAKSRNVRAEPPFTFGASPLMLAYRQREPTTPPIKPPSPDPFCAAYLAAWETEYARLLSVALVPCLQHIPALSDVVLSYLFSHFPLLPPPVSLEELDAFVRADLADVLRLNFTDSYMYAETKKAPAPFAKELEAFLAQLQARDRQLKDQALAVQLGVSVEELHAIKPRAAAGNTKTKRGSQSEEEEEEEEEDEADVVDESAQCKSQ